MLLRSQENERSIGIPAYCFGNLSGCAVPVRKDRHVLWCDNANINEGDRNDSNVILSATLTLLILIIGFTFSMAINRYDQRKKYEAAEATAISTEYIRAGLLPDEDAALVRKLLVSYLDQRILFYETRDDRELLQLDAITDRLEAGLCSAVQVPAENQPTPVTSLAVSGMNNVLNSRTNTQGAWLNRIPSEAWGLMAVVAIFSHLLIGFDMRRTEVARATSRFTDGCIDRVLSHSRYRHSAWRHYSCPP